MQKSVKIYASGTINIKPPETTTSCDWHWDLHVHLASNKVFVHFCDNQYSYSILAFQFLFADLQVPNLEVGKNRYVVGMFFTKYACSRYQMFTCCT